MIILFSLKTRWSNPKEIRMNEQNLKLAPIWLEQDFDDGDDD